MIEKKEITQDKAETSSHVEVEGKRARNPWVVSTIIFVLVAVVLAFFAFKGGGITGNVISEEAATEKLVTYLNSVTGGGIETSSTEDVGSLYKVNVIYQGDEIPVYITKDGSYFVQGAVPLSTQETKPTEPTPTDVPKTDKPVVEAFVFSYCPYGLQFEKAMAPVYDLLKDKAEINIVAIGAMHGEYEKVESLRQLCVQKEYGKDKLWDYLEKFAVDTEIGSCRGDEKCLDPLISKIFSQLNISKSKINSCMTKDAEALYNADVARAGELGQSGSPGFVINGVDVQVARNPEAIKQAICSAFNTAPSECEQTLSTASASAGFGVSASGSATSGTC